MAELDPQERRCIELASRYLEGRFGGEWMIPNGPTLVDQQPGGRTPPTPELIVTNGEIDAAIEVKRLSGDSVWRAYEQSLRSLKRNLAPRCGGYYMLNGSVDLRLPLVPRMVKHLKREIDRVAPTLGIGDTGFVRVPCQSRLRISAIRRPAYLHCSHSEQMIRALSPLLPSGFAYWIMDDDGWEHEFHSAGARERLAAAILAAVGPTPVPGEVEVAWYEEWELKRLDPGDRDDGVWVTAVTEAVSVPWSVTETVQIMLEAGLAKFWKRWAHQHVLVFDRSSFWTDTDRVAEALQALREEDEEPWPVNVTLLVEGEAIAPVWSAKLE